MHETGTSGYPAHWLIVVKRYHRHMLWVVLACLFALDIITTTVSLQLGYTEQNPWMIPFVDNPALHGIVKIGAFTLLFLAGQQAVTFIREERTKARPFWIYLNYLTLYGLILFLLFSLIWLYSFVLISNIRVIS